MLLGAARLLQNKRDELKVLIKKWNSKIKYMITFLMALFLFLSAKWDFFEKSISQGTVKLVFQPGEEGHAGAYHVLKEGALNDFQAIFGLHVSPGMPTGTVGSKPGPLLAGAARFSTVIKGKGGHAASPHVGRDPVLAASLAILALQQIVSRETDPLEARVFLLKLLHLVLWFGCEFMASSGAHPDNRKAHSNPIIPVNFRMPIRQVPSLLQLFVFMNISWWIWVLLTSEALFIIGDHCWVHRGWPSCKCNSRDCEIWRHTAKLDNRGSALPSAKGQTGI